MNRAGLQKTESSFVLHRQPFADTAQGLGFDAQTARQLVLRHSARQVGAGLKQIQVTLFGAGSLETVKRSLVVGEQFCGQNAAQRLEPGEFLEYHALHIRIGNRDNGILHTRHIMLRRFVVGDAQRGKRLGFGIEGGGFLLAANYIIASQTSFDDKVAIP